MAIPTTTYEQITFSPPLPMGKRVIVCNTKPGIYAKVIVTYAKPWWRENGLIGKFQSLKGPISMSWDISSNEHSSLALFICGKGASEWHLLGELARETAVIEHLAELVGPELAAEARDVLELQQIEWTREAYIGGAPTSSMGPGMLSRYGESLRAVFGHSHVAGGEVAFEWKGYLEGALTSGKHAAAEVVDILLKSSSK